MKVSLKAYTCSETIFNKILQEVTWKEYHQVLDDYLSGHIKKNCIMYNDSTLVCSRLVLSTLFPETFEPDDYLDRWYQLVVRKEQEQQEDFSNNISVIECVSYMNKVIKSQYSDEEREQILRSHEEDKAEIVHASILSQYNKILKFEDCYYYDINSAYGSELSKLFPKCKETFDYMYEHRKDNNGKFKKVFNYWVGCLTQNERKVKAKLEAGLRIRPDYSKSRNYIVNNITKKLVEFQNELDYELEIYTNTDGTIVQSPTNVIEHSDKMGDFKLEYHGDVYTYRTNNYTIIQYGNEIKGSLPLELRKYVDLRKGQVVKYIKHVHEDRTYEITDLEVINVYEEN